jgi:DNA primase
MSAFHPEAISLQDFVKRGEAENEYENRQHALPRDFTHDLPTSAELWLARAGIDPATWAAYGIGYSKRLDRAIIPVTRDGAIIGSIARRLGTSGPKYIENLPTSSVFDSLHGRSPKGEYDVDCVLTEDILSAIRVGRFVRSIALLGTGSSDAYVGGVLGFLGEAQSVGVWLDPDNAGQRATTKFVRALGMVGISTTHIKSLKDPKLHSDREIQEYLKHD